MANIIAIEKINFSENYEKRYILIDKDTGEILDDAQGYGYRTIQKAYASYNYKNRDKSKDKIKNEKIKHIKKWMKENKSFVKEMDKYNFEITKGSWGHSDKFDSKFVKKMLAENNLKPDFTASELLKVWLKN